LTTRPLRVRALARFIRLASLAAPRWQRIAWRDEWLGELFAWQSMLSVTQILRRAVGALAHIAWLWRREWSLNMIGSDTVFALRTLARRKGFAAAAILTLTLGIGATTAMFTLINAVLLRPLPYRQPAQIVMIWPGSSVSPMRLADATDRRGVFASVAAYSGWEFTITGGGQAEDVDGARVTPSLFDVLGAPLLAGRALRDDESQSGHDHVIVISEGLAVRRFGSAERAVGQSLIMDGLPHEVVGVMPASFAFPNRRADIWAPITIDPTHDDYRANFASLVGRLAPDTTLANAQTRLASYAAELVRDFPKEYGPKFLQRATLIPLQQRLVRDVRTPLLLVFGGVGVLLLIACGNVGNLLLARAAQRQPEIALRTSLGAARGRIVRQLLVESFVLSATGGAGGIVLAKILVSLFVPLVPMDLPHVGPISIDWRVVAFVCAAVGGSALVFGLLPALQLSRVDVRQLLGTARGGDRHGGGDRMRTAVVVAEVALATFLVVAAALLGRSFIALINVPIGFDPAPVLTVKTSLPAAHYPTDDQVARAMTSVLDRVATVPGVQSAGAIHLLPLTGDNWNPGVRVEGVPVADQYPRDINWRAVTSHYFATMSVPIIRGRDFEAHDDAAAAPVAIVNTAFVHAVLRDTDPIGRRIHTAFEGKDIYAEIIGVVGDVHQAAFDTAPEPEMYRPHAQHPLTTMRLMVRIAGNPADLVGPVRAAIADMDADIALADVEPMSHVVDRSLGSRRFPMMLAALFAAAAVLLGAVGVVGVLSHDIAERRREIGIRLALGAAPRRIQRVFLGRGLRLAGVGVATGLGIALLATRVLQSQLFGVSATDPWTIAGVGVFFLLVIAAAAYLPARRASRLDPLTTLRLD
jgi:putative ABC transport system permease protein